MEVHSIQTWVDRHEGVVVVEDDVQNIVRGIKEISNRLHVFYNPQDGGFDIVESCLDHTDRLVFSVAKLDNTILDRLRLADHWHGQETPNHVLGEDEDVISRVDAHNELVEQTHKEKFRDEIGDVGERLMWALDIVRDRPSVGGSISVPRSVSGESD